MNIDSIQVDHFEIPLPTVSSDSTHGEIRHFGVVTAPERAGHGIEFDWDALEPHRAQG